MAIKAITAIKAIAAITAIIATKAITTIKAIPLLIIRNNHVVTISICLSLPPGIL